MAAVSDQDRIARWFGPVAALTYSDHVKTLVATGMSLTRARGVAADALQTCTRCGHRVSVKSKAKRQRDDGGLDHEVCLDTP